MIVYLTVDDFLEGAQANADYLIQVRDLGLLQSALQRPAQTVFGEDAYPTLHLKAAAMMQSLARNHALVDGNKRSALDAVGIFYEWNGLVATFTEPAIEDLVVLVAEGKLDDVSDIAASLIAIATFEQL